MSDLENIELARYHREILADVKHMVGKYCRIMEWDIPEVDEAEARKLIFAAIRESLAEVEAGK